MTSGCMFFYSILSTSHRNTSIALSGMVIPCQSLWYLNIKSRLLGRQMYNAVEVMHAVIFTKGKKVIHNNYGCVYGR